MLLVNTSSREEMSVRQDLDVCNSYTLTEQGDALICCF